MPFKWILIIIIIILILLIIIFLLVPCGRNYRATVSSDLFGVASCHVNHSVAWQCVHCRKGDTASLREMAILGVLELRNPLTDWLKFWHTWLCQWHDLVAKFRKIRPDRGLPAILWNVHLAYFFDFSTQGFLARLYGKILNNFKRLMA